MRIYFFPLAMMLANSMTIFALEPCTILTTSGSIADLESDALAIMLSKASICPENIMQLEAFLIDKEWSFSSHMVANRGRNNPKRGSYSFFEVAKGPVIDDEEREIFLGHFTYLEGDTIALDQSPDLNKLLIEAIAFDDVKGLYNFYELIGQGNHAQWFYRGDSKDALLDNQYLHRTPDHGKKFGERMRCSACHNSGGPIMKELTEPYNDWWTNTRPLIFSHNLSFNVRRRVNHLNDAGDLANRVIMAMAKLEKSPTYRQTKMARSWQEILRPLFCATEINLESSDLNLNSEEAQFTLPSAFMINPLIIVSRFNFSTQHYRNLIDRFSLQFPETKEKDADHMWLTPVISQVDRAAIRALVNEEIITQKIALDILMIDFENPLFSEKRCALLNLIPTDVEDWLKDFKKNLAEKTNNEEAALLLKYLDEEDSYLLYHEPLIEAYVNQEQNSENEEKQFLRLLKIREQAFVDEISKNPLGQILEPGFRVIFPKPRS